MRLGVSLLPPQPPRVFSIRGLRLYLPSMGPWDARSVSLPSCSSLFICTQTWDCPVCNLLPRWVRQLPPSPEFSPTGCPSPRPLPVWMNVSSLTPWLSDFYRVQFSISSGCFFVFKFVVVLLLVVGGGTVCLPMPPSCPEG